MSRLVFGNRKEFLVWILKKCRAADYDLVLTDVGEAILIPAKSTRTLRYMYIATEHFESLDDAKKQIAAAIPGIVVVKLEKFDWDDTKPPYVRQEA